MVRHLHTRISESLDTALRARSAASGESVDHLVQAALAEAFEIEHHSLFQVSTSSALVEGVYQGCVNVADLLRHGDFGLGTFDSLDGEMIVLDGECFQARSDGSVVQAPADELTPFAVVTNFTADETDQLARFSDWQDLLLQLDRHRKSDNSFIGIRISGTMGALQLRAACKTDSGVDLVEATAHQSEFDLADIDGTLVGFWSPEFAGAVSIAGYH
ncbi:MAG: acetolactate decarboxylase, partial [Actinomycetota bacterium]|nr:acetolactate decarboxylase [Actinomycetota bacterium]